MIRRVGRFLRDHKFTFISWGASIVLITCGYLFWPKGPNPVPLSIKQDANFKVIYPNDIQRIDDTSWKYQSDSKIVTFSIKMGKGSAAVSEEEVPLMYKDDQAAYDRFVGSLKPYANFKVPLGEVTLANFVTAGDFTPTGLAGILKTHNTLIIVHPDSHLNQDDWENLFKSLKVSN